VAATNPDMTTQKVPVVDQGFTNMLLELHYQFDVLDAESDMSGYKVVIAPDEIRPWPRLVERVERFLAGGGALIASHESFLDAAKGAFALKGMGVRYLGTAKFKGEYLLLGDGFTGIEKQPYFLYQPGVSVAAEPGTETLATYGHPYFDRSPEHFSSHKQTPLGQRTMEPLITRNGRVAYIANPFFRSYASDGYGVQKQVVGELLRMLLDKPVVEAPGLPSTAQVTLQRQAHGDGKRTIAHVLYYPLTRRAPEIDIIEEPGLLKRVQIRVRKDHRVARAALVPQGKPLMVRDEQGYAVVEIPEVVGHQAVVFEG
jgi:hypothetical protein